MSKVSRRCKEASSQVEKKHYNYIEAITLLKQIASAKFIETMEAHIVLGLDPKYADQQLRSTVILPKGTGKNIKIAVITKSDNISQALLSSADIVGSEEIIDKILQGFLDFDKLIATPDMMPAIAKLGRILGPRGLMPSPKAGTVTSNMEQAVREFKLGKVEYKVDKTGILHVPFGKVDFSVNDLCLNLCSLQESIYKNRPTGSKGKYLKTFYICSTMGPSIPIDIMSLNVKNS
uniref:Large ribosomal subunit protein uL1c n=1 Tax=Batrachospermum sp. TaxID=31373 RepID=A0A8K1YV12_9FLOR|nr:ribosomal protein L1 [Batrachospermum sp.]